MHDILFQCYVLAIILDSKGKVLWYNENISFSNGSYMHVKVIWLHGSYDEMAHLVLNKYLIS